MLELPKPVDLVKLDNVTKGIALSNLKKYCKTTDEISLLDAIKNAKSKEIKIFAIVLLKEYGTNKSIPVLKQLIQSENEDMRAVSLLSLAAIARESETKTYVYVLESNDKAIQQFALAAIYACGDEGAKDAISALSKKILANDFSSKFWDWSSDPLYIIGYLDRVSGDDESIRRLSQRVVDAYYAHAPLSLRLERTFKKIFKKS